MQLITPTKPTKAGKDPDEFIRNAVLLIVILAVLAGLISGSVEGACVGLS